MIQAEKALPALVGRAQAAIHLGAHCLLTPDGKYFTTTMHGKDDGKSKSEQVVWTVHDGKQI